MEELKQGYYWVIFTPEGAFASIGRPLTLGHYNSRSYNWTIIGFEGTFGIDRCSVVSGPLSVPSKPTDK